MNRPLLLQLLNDHKSILSCIPLPPPAPVTGAQAIKDLLRERLVLNGVNFLGQGSLFLETLRRLTAKLCARPDVVGLWPAPGPGPEPSDPSPGEFVSDAILARCARTTSGADSYYTVSSLLGNPDAMLLKPREGTSGGPGSGGGGTHGSDAAGLPPIDIEVFVSGGSVHCAVSSTNCYGFYRFEDIESFGDRNSSDNNNNNNTSSSAIGGGGGHHAGGKGDHGVGIVGHSTYSSRDTLHALPVLLAKGTDGAAGDELLPGGAWLYLDTVVVEKIDFRTGRSLRFLRVEIPTALDPSTERHTEAAPRGASSHR